MIRIFMNLKFKGSSSGIGAVTAVHFAKLGCSVVVTGRDPYRTMVVARQCKKVAHYSAEASNCLIEF